MYLEFEDELPALLYEEYKRDWCEEHHYELEEMEMAAEDDEYSGDCFVCFDEFCDNEMQDGEYVVHLIASIMENSPHSEVFRQNLFEE